MRLMIFLVSFVFFTSLSCLAQPAKTLKIPLHAAQVTLDPSGVQDVSSLFVARQINCQLLRASGALIDYEAAKSIEYLSPTKIDIKIKNNFKFQDGSELYAQDIVATLEYLKERRNVLRNIFVWIKKVEVVNDKEMIIHLLKPVPQFLHVLSSPNYAIFKKSFIAKALKDPKLWSKPVGCGNYSVEINNSKIILLKPIKKGLPVEFHLNLGDQLSNDQVSQFDIVDLHIKEKNALPMGFKPITVFDPTQIFLGLNTHHSPWDDKKNRCDFLEKLNTEKILEAYGSTAKRANDILPSGVLGYKPAFKARHNSGVTLNPNRGVFKLKIASVSIPEDFRKYYAAMVRAVYPMATVDLSTNNKHFGSDFVASDSDAIIVGLKTNTFDGYDILAVFSEKDPNFTGFQDSDTVYQINHSQQESDPRIRAVLYRGIVKKILGSCLVYPILTIPNKIILVNNQLNTPNLGKGALNEYDLSQVY